MKKELRLSDKNLPRGNEIEDHEWSLLPDI